MTDLEMMKCMLTKARQEFRESIVGIHIKRTDLDQTLPPFDVEQVNGTYTLLSLPGTFACCDMLFDKDGSILEMDILS